MSSDHLAGLTLTAIQLLARCGDAAAAAAFVRETCPASITDAIRLAAPDGDLPTAGFDAIVDAYRQLQPLTRPPRSGTSETPPRL